MTRGIIALLVSASMVLTSPAWAWQEFEVGGNTPGGFSAKALECGQGGFQAEHCYDQGSVSDDEKLVVGGVAIGGGILAYALRKRGGQRKGTSVPAEAPAEESPAPAGTPGDGITSPLK